MTVTVGSEITPSTSEINHQTIHQIQNNLNLSDRQTLEAAKVIREGTRSRTSIAPNLKKVLTEHGRTLESFFQCKTLSLSQTQNKDVVYVEKAVVYCKDINSFIEFVLAKRKIRNNYLIKIGLDGGGGSMKICLNIFEDVENKNECGTDLSITEKQYKSKYLNTGVKKLFIIGIAFEVQESYDNVSKLMNILEIDKIQFVVAVDLKLANTIIGIQSHSSKHPCTCCEGSSPWNTYSQLRTLGRIREMVKGFRNTGGKQKKASDFMNCVQEPILRGDDFIQILDLIPPPELQCLGL